jgi:hypothetical protein
MAFQRRYNSGFVRSAFFSLLFALSGGGCDQAEDAFTESSYQRSFQEHGDHIDEYLVGDTTFNIPRSYSVMSSSRSDMILRPVWPGLVPLPAARDPKITHLIDVIVDTSRGYQSDGDREDALRNRIDSGKLSGPIWIHDLQLYIYQDEFDAPILLLSSPLSEVDPDRHVISCSGGNRWKERDVQCRVYGPLTDDLSLQYRFYSELLVDWRELESDIRPFVLSLIRSD